MYSETEHTSKVYKPLQLWFSTCVNSTPFAAECGFSQHPIFRSVPLTSHVLFMRSDRTLLAQGCWSGNNVVGGVHSIMEMKRMHWSHYSPTAISVFEMSYACSFASQNINQKSIKLGPECNDTQSKAALSPRWQRETPRLWTHAALSARGHYYWPWIGLRVGAKTESAQSPVSNTD